MNFLRSIKNFSWKQWLMLTAFILVIGFTGFQIYRTYERAVYWQAHRDEPIAEWMPVHYVANSYHVPPPVLFDTLKFKPKPGERRKPLGEIAVSQGRSFDELKADLEKAIAEFRKKHPTPPGGF